MRGRGNCRPSPGNGDTGSGRKRHIRPFLCLLCRIRTEEARVPRRTRETSGNVRAHRHRGGAGDDWTPRERRTSFVSLMSDQGVAIEEIARLAGHASTRTTEIVYRRELRSVRAAAD